MNNRITTSGVFLAGLLLAGCATSSGAKISEADALKARVDSLESQVAALNQRLEDGSQPPVSPETHFSSRSASTPGKPVKIRLTVRQVQKALAAAGYYKGPIDGKEGPQTKKAIKEFQQARGLKADGVVGARTSEALSKYLEERKEA